jgi:hypothetical protein
LIGSHDGVVGSCERSNSEPPSGNFSLMAFGSDGYLSVTVCCLVVPMSGVGKWGGWFMNLTESMNVTKPLVYMTMVTGVWIRCYGHSSSRF